LILTGPSHSGKTEVAKAILETSLPATAFLSVDDIVERVLIRASGDVWGQAPLAYELLCSQLRILLEHGWFVLIESTFTYVPLEGDPEFHAEALSRLVAEAATRNAPAWIGQLTAPSDVILARAERTDRLSLDIVEGTIALHKSVEFPLAPLVIDTSRLDPARAAEAILDQIRT
jgi:hypothetical protein